jgi:WD40 repeat protein
MKDGICKRVLAGHGGAVVSVKADKDKICSTSFDGMARVWSWAGRNELALEGHRGHVCGLWLQPLEEGTCVWTGADDGLVKKWDINTGTCVCEFSQEAISDTGMRLDTPCSVWCVHGTSGSAIVTGSTDASVRVWDTNSGREVCRMSGHQDAVAGLQLDHDKIVTSGFDGTVRVWDWRTLRCRGIVDLLQASRSNVSPHQRRCTRLSMDQYKVLVGCIDGTIYCIDVY